MPSKPFGIPDMHYINRHVPIGDLARALDLRFDGTRRLHCWHPDRHKHGDRTASVGIHPTNNTVKCFGCDSRPTGPIDLVMDVLDMTSPADAAIWIAARFDVPRIPARKKVVDSAGFRERVGHERGLELLIRSGLWAWLKPAAQAIAPVLLVLSEKWPPRDDSTQIRISYIGITRFSGIASHNAIHNALMALAEVGFLELPTRKSRSPLPDRDTSCYKLTPNSDKLWELAQVAASQTKQEIAAEVELRARLRNERIRSLRGNHDSENGLAEPCTK